MYGIFDFANEKLVKLEYTRKWYIRRILTLVMKNLTHSTFNIENVGLSFRMKFSLLMPSGRSRAYTLLWLPEARALSVLITLTV